MKRRKTLKIGQRVRDARQKAGLTLDALSSTSGVSKAMLSQIEQNKANPTVAVLYNVATSLNLEIADLLGQTGARGQFHVIRADDEKYQFHRSRDCTIRTLSPLRLEKDIEFYEIILHNRGKLESEPHFRQTEEFLTVVRGKVKVKSGQKESILGKGDSVHYSADVPHSLTSLTKSDSIIFLVVKYRER